MESSIPAILWPINFALPGGNPLCTGIADATPADAAQLIQGDQRLVRLYFQTPPAAVGGSATNVLLQAGFAITVAGKAADDLQASTLLFEVAGFVQLVDATGNYFYQAFLDLDKEEIDAAFAASGDGVNTLPCTAELVIGVPAQAASGNLPATPAITGRYQIPVVLQRQVYLGTESNPTPATPAYPPGTSVQALLAAFLRAVGGVLSVGNPSTGTVFPVVLTGLDAAPALAVLPAGTFVPAYAFPPGSAGQAILRNTSTGTAFPVLLDGSDAAPEFIVLPAGSILPATTYQLDGSGNLRLLNRATGNFLPVAITGTDALPTISVLPAPAP